MLDALPIAANLVMGTLAVFAGGSVAYLLTLLAAAKETVSPVGSVARRVCVVVPAHNEEPVVAATLRSLTAQNYPADLVRVVVIADNCTDATASIARESGAIVWERTNTSERGKGYALAWAFDRLETESDPSDFYVIVDADTEAAPDFLARIVARAASIGDRAAVQGRYRVLNSADGWRAALMAAAFDLVNHVKPMGRERLGLSAGLKGNGMIFGRETLRVAKWRGDSITEDLDFGLDLLEFHGIRVAYAPDAVVRAQMPSGEVESRSQRDRWEQGRQEIVTRRAAKLFWRGVTTGDFRKVDAALDMVIPPLTELFALLAAWSLVCALDVSLGWASAWWFAPVVLAWLGFFVYVFGGLKKAGASPEAWGAITQAPAYMVWKLVRYAVTTAKGVLYGKRNGGDEWVRTTRTPIVVTADKREETAP